MSELLPPAAAGRVGEMWRARFSAAADDDDDVDDNGALLAVRGEEAALGDGGRDLNAVLRPVALEGCIVGADETGPAVLVP
jgi:hypothetical protein